MASEESQNRTDFTLGTKVLILDKFLQFDTSQGDDPKDPIR